MCSLLLYVKRIIAFNAAYGRSAFLLGAVFIGSNVLAGSFNFYLGSLTAADLQAFKTESSFLWCITFVPFYALTEFLPATVFAVTMFKYGQIGEQQEAQPLVEQA